MPDLCLSDLHLGGDASVLTPESAREVGRQLAEWSRCTRAILVGDVLERSIPSSDPGPALRALVGGLASRGPIDLDLVCGNHDADLHHNGSDGLAEILGDARPLVGEIRVHALWHGETICGRRFVFTHGHIFDGLYRGLTDCDRAQQAILSVLACYPAIPGDTSDETSLTGWLERTGRWGDAVYCGPAHVEARREGWATLCRFDSPGTGCDGMRHDLAPSPDWISGLEWALSRDDAGPRPDVLVCGHTHRGGRGSVNGVEVWNCGAWTVDSPGAMPCAHALLIEDDGEVDLFRYAIGREAVEAATARVDQVLPWVDR